MVMCLVWLSERIDPGTWNPPPGALAYVTAEIDGEYVGEVRLETEAALELDPQTPAEQSTEPVRAVLNNLLAEWEEASRAESTSTVEPPPPRMVEDLRRYLQRRLPTRQLNWTIRTPREPGRYAISLVAGQEAKPVRAVLVVGDRFPPEPREDLGDGQGPLQRIRTTSGTPIEQVTVSYQFSRAVGDRVFFAPLENIPLQALDERGWSTWDAGWLLTYIVAYLAVLLPLRWFLRIP
jgi:hypothetical protein